MKEETYGVSPRFFTIIMTYIVVLITVLRNKVKDFMG